MEFLSDYDSIELVKKGTIIAKKIVPLRNMIITKTDVKNFLSYQNMLLPISIIIF